MLVLVAARFVQGLGAGTLQPIAYVAIGRTLPEALRPRMFATLSTAWVLPGLIGPAVAGAVGEHIGWRFVFLGLLPLIVLAGALTLGALRAVAPAPVRTDDAAAAARRGRLPLALAVALGAGLLTVGLTTGEPLPTVVLSAVGLIVLIMALRRLTPPGTLVARPVLPAAVLLRGVLTCAFFGCRRVRCADPGRMARRLRHGSGDRPDRGHHPLDGRRLDPGPRRDALADLPIRPGRFRWSTLIGLAGMVLVLRPEVTWLVAVPAFGIAGLGMGLAYSPLALIVLREAAVETQGAATSALSLTDSVGTALGTGLTGAIVAASVRSTGGPAAGLAVGFLVAIGVGLVGLALTGRLRSRTAPATTLSLAPASPPS